MPQPSRQEPYWSSGLIVLVCSLSFGLHIGQLGFYWDDYASLYVYRQEGRAVFVEWVNGQGRPLAGYLFGGLMEVTGQQALGFHLLNFGLYTLGVWALWRVLRLLWPAHPTLMTLIALLFAVYPSYHLRPVAVGIQITLSVTLLLLSLWAGLEAVRRNTLALSLISAGLIVLYPLLYEQSWFYEALRPLLLLYLLYQGGRALGWQRWGWLYAPQALGGLSFILYRALFYQPNSTYADYNQPVRLESLDGLLLTVKSSIAAPMKLLTVDWVYMPWRIFIQQGADFDLPALLGVIFLGGGLVYLWRYPAQGAIPGRTALLAWGVGLPMMSLTLALVYSVGNDLGDGTFSRWALVPSLVAAPLLGLGLSSLVKHRIHSQVLLLILVVIGLACQAATSQLYAQDWALRREVGWQLRWRYAALPAPTMVVLTGIEDQLAFGRSPTDYELTAWLSAYYPASAYPNIVGAERRSMLNLLAQGQPRQGNWGQTLAGRPIIYREWAFDLDSALILASDGGCLNVADPTTRLQASPDPTLRLLAPYHTARATNLTPLAPSDTDLIGPEPAHDWCFYYQQVSAALEVGQTDTALALAQQAQAQGLSPVRGAEAEWLPFLWAYWGAGEQEAAEALLRRIALADANTQQLLCQQVQARDLLSPDSVAAIHDQLPYCGS